MRRVLACLIVAALAWAPVSAGGARAADIRIGMRADAKPFVWEESPGRFVGFFADLCREAVRLAGYPDFTEIRVTAGTRFDESLDLICDPTTLTLERARRLDFTQILFVANATFAEVSPARVMSPELLRKHPECQGAGEASEGVVAVGMLAGTTAGATYRLAREGGWLSPQSDGAYCVIGVGSHPEGIDLLCSGVLTYYFADADILRAYLRDRPDCGALLHPTFFTYEPYALVVRSSDPEFRRALVRALYALFSSKYVDEIYSANFGDSRRSPALDFLFSLNAVPAGESASGKP